MHVVYVPSVLLLLGVLGVSTVLPCLPFVAVLAKWGVRIYYIQHDHYMYNTKIVGGCMCEREREREREKEREKTQLGKL